MTVGVLGLAILKTPILKIASVPTVNYQPSTFNASKKKLPHFTETALFLFFM
jgi:hypothetical protein